MDVGSIVGFLRRSAVVIVVAAVLGVAVGVAVFAVQPPVYRATAQVLLSTDSATSTAEIVQGSDFAISRVETYAELVGSDLVLAPVIADLGLDETTSELAERVSASVVPSTALIEVHVDAPSADEAATIANATAASLQAVVVDLESTPQAASPLALTVTDAATAPSSAASPRLEVSTALGLALGLLAGIAVALVRAGVDPRVDAEQDLRRMLDAPVLGRLHLRDRGPASGDVPEGLRSLRTSVRALGLPEGGRALLVVEVGTADAHGASATTMRLALALAESGAHVLVIEAHLGGRARDGEARDAASVGLSDVLLGRAALVDAATTWRDTTVDVLSPGTGAPRGSGLLEDPTLAALLDTARSAYDWVLVDAPALPALADAAVLAQHADGALLVVRERRTRTRDLGDAVDALDRAGATLRGVVLLAPRALPAGRDDAAARRAR